MRSPNADSSPTRSRRPSTISSIPARCRRSIPAGPARRSCGLPARHDPHRVVMHNGRLKTFTLERDGFRFVRHDTKVADFFSEDEVRRVYYPEMEALVKAETGCSRVVVFDHTLRTADDGDRETRKIREPVAACTTTTRNGPGRSACATCCRRRPMICSSAASRSCRSGGRSATRSRPSRLRSATQRACRRRTWSCRSAAIPIASARPTRSPTIPTHVWYWFPRMRREEAIVFKVYDSLKDGRARWTAHTAFDDPTAPAARAAAREHRDPHAGVFLTRECMPTRSIRIPRPRQPRVVAARRSTPPRDPRQSMLTIRIHEPSCGTAD